MKMNWLSFALANHLNKDLNRALTVIDSYLQTLSPGSPELERGFESSELALYRNSIVAEMPNNYEAALQHLHDCENVVVDRGAWMFAKADYEMQLGRYEHARETFRDMLQHGAIDDYRIHSGFMCALLELDAKTCAEGIALGGIDTIANTTVLTTEQRKLLLDCYQNELAPKFPRSQAIERIPLTLLSGDNEMDDGVGPLSSWLE